MKTKGITIVEKYAEKLVLALFTLGALAILLLQVGLLAGREGIRVGGVDRPIDRALAAVRDSALQRRARIESDQVAPGVPPSLPDPLEVFERGMSSTAGSPPLAVLGTPLLRLDPAGASPAVGTSIAIGDAIYAPIAVPPPSAPITCVFEGTIDPIEVASIGQPLASLLPGEQPFDTRAVSVQVSFGAEALRRSIEQPAGEGAAPLPASMWQGRLELVDVEWTRQRLTESGEWADDTTLPPVPGRQSLRALVEKPDLQLADFAELLERERVVRPDIRRPAFYSTISGQFWTWPEQARKEAELREAEDVIALRRELTLTRRTMEQIRRQIDALGRPQRQPTPPGRDRRNPSGGGGGGDRGPSADNRPTPRDTTIHPADEFVWPRLNPTWLAQSGPGTGGGAPPPPPPEGGGSQPDDRRRDREAQVKKRLEDELARHTKREQEILAELQKKGVTETGAVIASEFSEPFNSLAHPDSKQVALWTHDLSVRPGATYRYRARARVTNPLFGQAERLKPEQRDLASQPVLTGPHSEWSEPVSIDPSWVYFVSSATEPGGLLDSPARAGIEVFQFYYGYWRRATLTLGPGDPIIATVELPELTTFELERDTSGRFAVKERTPVEKQRQVSTPVFLIATASSVGGAQGAAQAYLRDEHGRVAVRRPAAGDARESRHRTALSTSATIGRTAPLREPGTGAPATPLGGQGSPPGTGPGLPGGTPPPGPGGPPSLPKRDERN